MERLFIDSEFQELIDTLQEDRKCGNLIKLKEDAIRLKEESIHSGNEYAESVAYYFLAIYYLMRNEPAKSIAHCNSIKEKYSKQQFHYLYSVCCNLAGTAYIHLNDRQTAIGYLLDGYYISLEYSFFDIQTNILNNIGSIFYELEDYEGAIEYFLSAYNIIQEKQQANEKMIEMLLVNLSSSYVRINKFKEAKYWEQKYLEKFSKNNNVLIRNSLLVNHILMENIPEFHSQLSSEVHQFLESIQGGWNDLYSLKMILEVIEFCLKENNTELSKKSIALAEDKMKHCHNTIYKEQFASAKIQLYELTGEKEKLFEALLDYHKFVRQGKNEKKEIEISGVVSRINLEHAEYRKRQVEIKNKELEKLNERDPFTGLLNKVSFEKKVQERLENRIESDGKDILLLIDIDNFKQINDTYGHAVGDQVIKEVSNRLKNKTRHSDYVGRIGGDEFCALLLDIPNIEVLKLWIKNFIKSVQRISCDKISAGRISVSVGAASSNGENTNLELFEKADQAMYEAKKKGKNTYGIYAKDIH